jgi:hypothetical protein
MFENSEIRQAVNSVYKSLQSRIIKTYGITDVEEAEEIADKLLKIHGMDRDHFSIIKQIEEMIAGKLNDNSIDDNSNKNEKTIKGIMKESVNPIEKILGYRFLYRKMVELYGKKEAKYLTSLMYDYTLALSDSTNILVPYCWAFDSSKLISMGKPFGQLPSSPVKRFDSYASLINEVTHQMSNHLAGAIAHGTFFLDIAHLLLVKENKRIEDLKDKNYRKYIKNQYQKVVHGFNSLSRSGGTESPFTNISIFDRVKLNKLVKEEYSWHYIDLISKELKEGEFPTINGMYIYDYVIEFIIELQNIYMEFFDEGDPLNDGMPYRFPIVTLNISKKKDKDNKWVIEDKQFLKSACKKDIYRYNIFVSEGNKIASCCFSGEQIIKVYKDENEYLLSIKDFVELFSKDLIDSNIDTGYLIDSFNFKNNIYEKSKVTGVLCKENEQNVLIEIEIDNLILKVTPDHIFTVLDLNDNSIKEIEALDLLQNKDRFLLPVEE